MAKRGRPARRTAAGPVVSVDTAEPTTVAEAAPAEKVSKIYWVPNKQYRIANFQPEIKGDGGHIIQPEGSLVIPGMLETDDPAKIAFIESSIGFTSGEIQLVESMDHGNAKTHEHRRKKMKARVVNEDEEDQGLLSPITVAAAGQGAG
jgi:hypothetical protein